MNRLQIADSVDPGAGAPWWELGFTGVALFLLTGAVVPLLRGEEAEAALLEGDPLSQALHAVVYVVALLLLLRCQKVRGLIGRVPLTLWALMALVLLSVFWSDDPSLTLRRGGAVIGTTLVGVYVGIRYELEDQLRIIAAVLTVAAALSVLFVVGTSLGIMEGAHDGAWRGVFSHKNGLGRMMALLAVVGLTQMMAGRLRSPMYWACFSAGTVLVVLSQSRTALAVYLGALGRYR